MTRNKMGTQYEILNLDTKEFITAQSLGWDYKYYGSCWSDFNNLLIYLLHHEWKGCRISMMSLEHLDYEDRLEYADITKEVLEEYIEDFGEQIKRDGDVWWK